MDTSPAHGFALRDYLRGEPTVAKGSSEEPPAYPPSIALAALAVGHSRGSGPLTDGRPGCRVPTLDNLQAHGSLSVR
jgi:hypothetical protein